MQLTNLFLSQQALLYLICSVYFGRRRNTEQEEEEEEKAASVPLDPYGVVDPVSSKLMNRSRSVGIKGRPGSC